MSRPAFDLPVPGESSYRKGMSDHAVFDFDAFVDAFGGEILQRKR